MSAEEGQQIKDAVTRTTAIQATIQTIIIVLTFIGGMATAYYSLLARLDADSYRISALEYRVGRVETSGTKLDDIMTRLTRMETKIEKGK